MSFFFFRFLLHALLRIRLGRDCRNYNFSYLITTGDMFTRIYSRLKKRHEQLYFPIKDTESDTSEDGSDSPYMPRPLDVLIYIILIISLAAILFLGSLAGSISSSPASFSPCRQPAVRREWKPARFRLNGSLYDDFAALHGSIGSWC